MNLLKRKEASLTNSVISPNSVISSNSEIRQFGNSVISSNSVIRPFGHSVIRPHSVISHKGFTIIELLVASLLLGMLMTILTMIFNQSSIAWRTGMAGTVDMDEVRENIAEIREEADNAFVWGGTLYRITSVWGKDGNLRKRACDAPNSGSDESEMHAGYLRKKLSNLTNLRPDDFLPQSVGNGTAGSANAYTVNVMSAGPNRKFDDYDDIWSWPDDFE